MAVLMGTVTCAVYFILLEIIAGSVIGVLLLLLPPGNGSWMDVVDVFVLNNITFLLFIALLCFVIAVWLSWLTAWKWYVKSVGSREQ